MTPILQLCECNDMYCAQAIELPIELIRRKESENLVMIIDGCKKGPSPGDIMMEQGDGFAFYKEAEVTCLDGS